MAEGEAAGQVPEARSVVSRHSGSAGRDARETQTGRLRQPIMDWRKTMSKNKRVFILDIVVGFLRKSPSVRESRYCKKIAILRT